MAQFFRSPEWLTVAAHLQNRLWEQRRLLESVECNDGVQFAHDSAIIKGKIKQLKELDTDSLKAVILASLPTSEDI